MRIGLLTDLHFARPRTTGAWHNPYEFAGAEARLRAAMRHFARADVDLIALTGDVVHHGDDTIMRRSVGLCAETTSAPLLIVAGNHDTVDDAERLDRAVESVGRHVRMANRRPERHGDVAVAGVHVACGDGWFGSRLREHPDVAAWDDRPVVLLSHFPALSAAADLAGCGLPYPGDLTDRVELAAALLGRQAPTVVLSGDIHARTSRAAGPVLQLTQAAAIEAPHECSIVTIERQGDGVLVSRAARSLQSSSARRVPVLCPTHETWTFGDGAWSDDLEHSPPPSSADPPARRNDLTEGAPLS